MHTGEEGKGDGREMNRRQERVRTRERGRTGRSREVIAETL